MQVVRQQIGAVAAVVLIALAITLALSGGGEAGQSERERDTRVPVELIEPEQTRHQIRVQATGTVQAKAFVTLKPQQTATEDEIIEHCREKLAGFKVPKAVEFGELPKTSTGKIQKFLLRNREWEAHGGRIN